MGLIKGEVKLEQYDVKWQADFLAEKAELEKIFGGSKNAIDKGLVKRYIQVNRKLLLSLLSQALFQFLDVRMLESLL